jgi:type I restriction enzyme S subunit
MTAVSIETPNGWLSVRLDAVGTVVTGSTPPTRDRSYYGHERMFASPADLGRSKYVTRTSKWVSRRGFDRSRPIPGGSTLFVCIGSTIGKVGLAADEMTANQQINAIIPSHQVDHEYLYYAAATLSSRVREQAGEQAVPLVNKSDFSAFEILLPPPDEQRAIACALAEVDQLITALERLIAKEQSIKQGMMQELLTGKSRLPGFTEPWRRVRLGDHVTYVKTVALSRAQLDESSPLRYLHYGDIHTRSGVTLDASEEGMPRVVAILARNAGRLQPGDLVFADASEDPAGVGKSVEILAAPSEGVVPGLHTIAARFDKAVLADGFKAYLQFIPTFRDSLLRLAAGTKVLATTRSYISSVTLSMPGVDEQRAIAETLTDCDREISALHSRLAKAGAVKQGMMQELLTGRTRLLVAEEAA